MDVYIVKQYDRCLHIFHLQINENRQGLPQNKVVEGKDAALMPYVPISYIGWPEDWFDTDGEPRVNEPIIKYFVNRYFAFPDERDDEGPITRIWVKCKACAFVKEHEMRIRETEVEWENYQYNGDNTFTFLPEPYCNECNPSKERKEAIKNLHTIKSVWNDPSTRLSPITIWDDENNNGDMSLIMIWVRDAVSIIV